MERLDDGGRSAAEPPAAVATVASAGSRPRDDAEPAAFKRKANAAMLIITGCMVLEWFRLGLYQEIIGPTLPFLKSRIGSDYSSVTQALSGKAIGLVIGATLGGIFENKLRHASSLIICASVVSCACCMAALPFALHIGLYWAAFTAMGLLEGAINIFGQGVLLTMWQAKAAGPLQLLHFGFGCGSCIMPLVVSLFFPKKEGQQEAGDGRERLNGSCVNSFNQSTSATAWSHVDSSNTSAGWLSDEHTTTRTTDSDHEGSLVPYAYVLLGVFGAVCSFLFGALFLAERRNLLSVTRAELPKPNMALSHSFHLRSCLPHSYVKVALVLVLMVAFCALLAATDRTFGSFIFVYAKEELCFSNSKAVALNSAFWGVFTGGRVVGFFIAHRVHPKFLLPAEVVGMAACSLVLAIFKGSNYYVTWVFCLGTALFLGPIFPSLLAWANRYFNVTGMVITLIMLGVAVGVAVCQVVIGYFLEHYGAEAVVYFASGQTGLLIVLTVAMQALAYTIGDRFDTSEDSSNDNTPTQMATVKVNLEENGGQEDIIELKKPLVS